MYLVHDAGSRAKKKQKMGYSTLSCVCTKESIVRIKKLKVARLNCTISFGFMVWRKYYLELLNNNSQPDEHIACFLLGNDIFAGMQIRFGVGGRFNCVGDYLNYCVAAKRAYYYLADKQLWVMTTQLQCTGNDVWFNVHVISL